LESMRSTGELRLVLKSSCGGGAANARARGGGGGGGREGSGMAGEGSGMAGEGILKLAKGGTAASSRTRRDMRDEPSSASSGSDSDSSSSSIARSHSLSAGASERQLLCRYQRKKATGTNKKSDFPTYSLGTLERLDYDPSRGV